MWNLPTDIRNSSKFYKWAYPIKIRQYKVHITSVSLATGVAQCIIIDRK